MKFEKYFGTDGIRGKVGFFPITPEFILKLGWASGKVLSCHGKSRKIIIGKDTRVSGYMLESALESGLSAAGTSIALTGPIPTPAVAYLTRIFKASAGIVISASHNHYCDNGIKFFSVEGKKLINTIENRIEEQLSKSLICVKSQFLGKATRIVNASERYIRFCKKTFPKHLTLKGLKIVVDCANGATYQIAPNIFRELGADVITIGCKPNGFNINKRCGTTDVRQLRFRVLKNRANLGVAYDGDGDRVIMIDHHGNIISGDQILFVIAREQFRQKKLIGGVVGTLMSNMGLMLALKKLNIPFIRTSVGDRYILEMLQRKGWRIGGENSGHIILLDKTTTGDGIIVTLQVLSFMMTNCLSLYELCQGIFLFPQVLMNIYYSGSKNPLKSNLVIKVIKKIERELSNTGRLVLRFSGTEPCIRIMVEGEKSKISHMANEIATTIKTVC